MSAGQPGTERGKGAEVAVAAAGCDESLWLMCFCDYFMSMSISYGREGYCSDADSCDGRRLRRR